MEVIQRKNPRTVRACVLQHSHKTKAWVFESILACLTLSLAGADAEGEPLLTQPGMQF